MKEDGKFTEFVEIHIGFDGTIGLEHELSSFTTLARDANPRLHVEENSIKRSRAKVGKEHPKNGNGRGPTE